MEPSPAVRAVRRCADRWGVAVLTVETGGAGAELLGQDRPQAQGVAKLESQAQEVRVSQEEEDTAVDTLLPQHLRKTEELKNNNKKNSYLFPYTTRHG